MAERVLVRKGDGRWRVLVPSFGFGSRGCLSHVFYASREDFEGALLAALAYVKDRTAAQSLSSSTGHEVWSPSTSRSRRW